jgi:hypothetical protein
MQEAEPERGLDRGSPKVAFDPVEDRLEPDELARSVQVQQAIDEIRAAFDDRETLGEPGASRGETVGDRPGTAEVCLVELGAPLVATALAAADRAGVELAGARSVAIRGRRRGWWGA